MEIQVFNFENLGQLQGGIFEEKPYVDGHDLCKMLDIKNVRDAVSRLDSDEYTFVVNTNKNQKGRPVKQILVFESGVYTLILTSRKPEAKIIRKKITSEVMPALREKGYYITPQAQEQLNSKVDDIREWMIEEMDRREKLQTQKTIELVKEGCKTVAVSIFEEIPEMIKTLTPQYMSMALNALIELKRVADERKQLRKNIIADDILSEETKNELLTRLDNQSKRKTNNDNYTTTPAPEPKQTITGNTAEQPDKTYPVGSLHLTLASHGLSMDILGFHDLLRKGGYQEYCKGGQKPCKQYIDKGLMVKKVSQQGFSSSHFTRDGFDVILDYFIRVFSLSPNPIK